MWPQAVWPIRAVKAILPRLPRRLLHPAPHVCPRGLVHPPHASHYHPRADADTQASLSCATSLIRPSTARIILPLSTPFSGHPTNSVFYIHNSSSFPCSSPLPRPRLSSSLIWSPTLNPNWSSGLGVFSPAPQPFSTVSGLIFQTDQQLIVLIPCLALFTGCHQSKG